jgi:hypothetical protein
MNQIELFMYVYVLIYVVPFLKLSTGTLLKSKKKKNQYYIRKIHIRDRKMGGGETGYMCGSPLMFYFYFLKGEVGT